MWISVRGPSSCPTQEKSGDERSEAGSQQAEEDYDVDEEYDNDYAENYFDNGEGDDVLWFKQTIGNACGLYGLLHAVTNGKARDYISTYATHTHSIALLKSRYLQRKSRYWED